MGKSKQMKTPKKEKDGEGDKKKDVPKKLNRDKTPSEKKREQQQKEYDAMSPEKQKLHDDKKAAKKERRKNTTKVINR